MDKFVRDHSFVSNDNKALQESSDLVVLGTKHMVTPLLLLLAGLILSLLVFAGEKLKSCFQIETDLESQIHAYND